MKQIATMYRSALRITTVVLITCCTATAVAQPLHGFRGGPGRPGGPLLGVLLSPALQLTPDQLSAVKVVIDSHKTSLTEALDTLKSAEGSLLSYVKEGNSDDVASYTIAIGEAVAALRTTEAAVFVEASALLTDEQKAILAALSLEESISGPPVPGSVDQEGRPHRTQGSRGFWR